MTDQDNTNLEVAHPWIAFESPAELEAWMELNNQELQKLIGNRATQGQGICFNLLLGGEIYFHTNGDGDILLDVTSDAQWVAPLITACTQVDAPRGQIWHLPQHDLIAIIMGLNPLIASSRLVTQHAFRIQKF
ncbi:hypothetical protein [Undibacterium sp. Ji22W]|uniref:hypothetical protein n=1 Tax=Undibacterium sp. Ji22W TaxID=3413038 RepID=UPI003BF1B435